MDGAQAPEMGKGVRGGWRGPFYSNLDRCEREETLAGFQSRVESKFNDFPFKIKFSVATYYSSA
jgi:hypothetical protein